MMRLIRFKDVLLGVASEAASYIMSVELKKFITVVLSRLLRAGGRRLR